MSELGEVVEVDWWPGGGDQIVVHNARTGGIPVERRTRRPHICYILFSGAAHPNQGFPLFLKFHLLFLAPFFFKHDGLEVWNPGSAVCPGGSGGDRWKRGEGILP